MTNQSVTPADDGTLAPLLTINQVAPVLGVSRAKVYELMRDDALISIRVGERARFDPADVRAYLERNREGAPDAS